MIDEDKARHDLKNHLTIIRGFAELLLAETGAGVRSRADLEEIYRAAVSALDLLGRAFPAHTDTPS